MVFHVLVSSFDTQNYVWRKKQFLKNLISGVCVNVECNHGKCLPKGSNGYACECDDGWSGSNCDNKFPSDGSNCDSKWGHVGQSTYDGNVNPAFNRD
jgi:hypothetical protein